MEIPYIVTPRKDTGLFNSKIAIWLFLASEVMLFGGFFSAYVYLRLGAEHDYPWPERSLPVIPGLINTFVLIFSSVTVVFAWASLKLRQWRRFQIFMSITVACSGIFMVLKGIEYNVKFHHQALRLMDYTVVEGHLAKVTEKPAGEAHEEHGAEEHGGHAEGPLVHDRNGDEIEANVINFETTELTFNTVRAERPWVAEMIADATEQKAKITLAADVKLKGSLDDKQETVFPAGTELSQKLIDDIDKLHLKARGHNAAVRTENLRKQWKIANDANKGVPERDYQDKVAVDEKAIAGELLTEQAAITFKVDPAVTFRFKPHDIKETATDGTLRDGTMLKGKLLA
ncbi:MAG: hypothetical protein JWO82_2461, partial [Akkermansiaceae bacterium]|nr:hypothetical protein [Akkermansiaceae bacterium]